MIPSRVAYILHVFPKLSETFIANELAELRRRGVGLRILSLLPPRDEVTHRFIGQAGLDELTSYDPAHFSEILEEFKPEILHAHFATEATAAARGLSNRHSVPYTFTCHGYDIFRKPPNDFSARAADARRVVTVSRANADYLTETFGVDPTRIRILPCGVDTTRFRPDPSQEHTEPPLILCVARLVQVKNLRLLLEACALLRDRGNSFRCILVGEGPSRAELEGLRGRLGLEDLVELPGAAEQGEVVKHWQRADVGVLTSSSEGMPVCLMEAASVGVPVVATAVGGVPELVNHESTGLLVRPGAAMELALALERLLKDKSFRIRLGLTARQLAVARFSVTKQVDGLLELWGSVLNGGRG